MTICTKKWRKAIIYYYYRLSEVLQNLQLPITTLSKRNSKYTGGLDNGEPGIIGSIMAPYIFWILWVFKLLYYLFIIIYIVINMKSKKFSGAKWYFEYSHKLIFHVMAPFVQGKHKNEWFYCIISYWKPHSTILIVYLTIGSMPVCIKRFMQTDRSGPGQRRWPSIKHQCCFKVGVGPH